MPGTFSNKGIDDAAVVKKTLVVDGNNDRK